MTETEYSEIELLLAEEKAAEAQKRLENTEPENSVRYWMIKGKIEQKFQNWGPALNAFSNVLKIDDGNKEAQNNISIIRNILNFWNPEMFNP